MRDLQFALLGAGFWAPYQLAAWQELQGAQCVAVCDLTRSKADSLAAKHGISRVYENAEELFSKESLDFVDIVTSSDSHQQLVHLAASYGIPTICQKPLGESLEECQRTADACREFDVPLLVHENFRWQRPLRELRKALDSQCIGNVFRARLHYCSSFPVFDNQPFLRNLKRFMLTDVGTHILDVARFLFGEADSLYCRIQQINASVAGEDVATIMLTMKNGSTLLIEMSYATLSEHERFPETFVFVEGEQGSIELGPDYWLRVTTSEGTHAQRVPPPHYKWADPEYDLIHSSAVDCNRNLLESFRNGTTAETTVEDNLKTLQLVFAAYESAEAGQVVNVDSLNQAATAAKSCAGNHKLKGPHIATKEQTSPSRAL